MDDYGYAIHLSSRVKMMKQVKKWAGFWKDQFSENVWHCGGVTKEQQPGEDLVLDHIILDLTGDSVPLEQIADASVQREFKRKKRLLRQSNTVLCSRLGIMGLVAVMLVVTTLLTWYFTSTYGARSVKSLANVLRQQLLRASMQAMVSILGEVYNGTVVLSSLHQQVFYATQNATWDNVEPGLRWVNRAVFDSQRQYTSVAFVAADGRLTDFTRSATADYLFFVNVSSNASNAVWYYQNVSGYLNESLAPPAILKKPPYPVSAGNVLSLEPLERVYWTIAPNSLGEAVVSPAVPFEDLITNTVLGVATITSTFQYLNTYLTTLDLLGGYVYFEWHNGTGRSSIVAFSYGGTSDILASPYNSSNPIVRSAAIYLSARYGHRMLSLSDTHNEDVSLVGQKFYIDTVRLSQSPYDALNLTAIMILPRKAIMGRIDKRNRTVIHVIVGTAVGILVLGCCFVCFLTRKMSTEMQLRQELIRLLVGKHRAEQSSNYKSQFLANMSHELRTPIAGIIGLLDLLSCDSLTSEQEFSVLQIRRCATGLLSLVNNVLDISKAEAGRMELEVAPFSIADELESLVDMFAAQSVGSNIDLVLDLSDNIPPFVRGDSVRIRQIFSNLISNSLKFTTHGHILVRGWVDQSLLEPNGKQQDFSMHRLSGRERVSGPIFHSVEDQLCLVFDVADSGCGISPELHEKVFDSFVQADSSTTRTHGGSGLGLYMVRSLVELMGGEVAVVAAEGPGTVMRFHIIVERASDPMPVHRASASSAAQALDSPTEQDGLDSFLGSPFKQFEPLRRSLPEGLERTRVLLAMQDGVARNVAVAWLERGGLRVTCVEAWAAVIPTLEFMAKNSSLEAQSDSKAVRTDDDPGGGGRGGGVHSPGSSSSQASEHNLEFADYPSVLALVDVTLIPSMNIDFDRQFVDPGDLGGNESSLSRAEVERLPSHMQEMLEGMLRIHRQQSIAVSWIVAPDCGAKWKQALQADERFLVLNKPLHGSRLRRLLSFLAMSGKVEPHHWEVLDNSLFGTPSSPRPRAAAAEAAGTLTPSSPRPRAAAGTLFPKPRNLESSHLAEHHHHHHRRSSLEQIPVMSSHRTSSARKSSDQEPKYLKPESLAKDSTALEAPSARDAHSNVIKVRSVGGEEASVSSVNQKDAAESSLPKSTTDSLSGAPEGSRKVPPAEDTGGNPFVLGKAFDRASSQNTPSNGLQKYQNVVVPVEIPHSTDESRRLLGSSTPESPLSGQSTPSGPVVIGIGKSKTEIGTTSDAQEIRKNGAQVRRVEDEWGGPRHAQQQKQSPVSGSGNVGNVGQTSHEKPAPRPERGLGSLGQASAFIHKALSGMHILLVEDTAVLQRLVSMTLKKLGANVTVVGDGLQAVTAVADTVETTTTRDVAAAPSHFDLILMDCAMPVMDGYNATKAIREAEENTNRHIPIVALTAHALASDEERCLSVGMDAYLTKPINCKLMVTTIRGLLSKGKT